MIEMRENVARAAVRRSRQFKHSDFDIPSDFDIRDSDFRPVTDLPRTIAANACTTRIDFPIADNPNIRSSFDRRRHWQARHACQLIRALGLRRA